MGSIFFLFITFLYYDYFLWRIERFGLGFLRFGTRYGFEDLRIFFCPLVFLVVSDRPTSVFVLNRRGDQ